MRAGIYRRQQSGAHVEERKALEGTEARPVEGFAELDEIFERIQESLCADNTKPSLTDLIHLLELRRELAQPQTMPVTVRWIDEWQQTPDYEE